MLGIHGLPVCIGEPPASSNLGRPEAVVRGLLKEAFDEVLELRADAGREHRLIHEDLAVHNLLVLAIEGRDSDQHFVQDDADLVHVA